MVRVAPKTTRQPTIRRRQPTIRSATPDYSVSALEEALKGHITRTGVEKAFDLGIYKAVPIGHAVRGRGLVALAPLIRTLQQVARHLTFKHRDLKVSLTNLAFCFQDLWDKRRPIDMWAAGLAERLFTICNHVRKISNSPVRMKQCQANMASEEQQDLLHLVERTEPTGSRQLLDHEPTAPTSSSRQLLVHDSDTMCSVDSDGFPNILHVVTKSMEVAETVYYKEEGVDCAPQKAKCYEGVGGMGGWVPS